MNDYIDNEKLKMYKVMSPESGKDLLGKEYYLFNNKDGKVSLGPII